MRIIILSDNDEELENHQINTDVKNSKEMLDQSMRIACIINEAIAGAIIAKREGITLEDAMSKVRGQIIKATKNFDRYNFKERN